MDKIIVIKANGFSDIIYDEVGISEDYVNKEDVDVCLENVDDGMFKILVRKIYHDKGQMGDFGQWEIAPYYNIDKCTVTKICDIFDHTTNSEKIHFRNQKRIEKMKKLQEWVSSFSSDKVKYALCKIWQYDKLALRTQTGETFQMFSTIHEFQNDEITNKNINFIKQVCLNYFNSFEKTEAGGQKIK